MPAIPLNITATIRARDWWEYKLAPIGAAFYATAATLHLPVTALWPALLITFLSIVPGAAYVSVINDLTDREDDLAAGKTNRLAGRPALTIAAFVALPIVCGLTVSYLWRRDHLLLSFYLAAWLAFALYSLPPFRFKSRGILGVLCDASGAHLFPTLVAVVLAYRGAARPIAAPWLIAIAVWSFGQGLRGILWHQLLDVANDRLAGVHTFAERHARGAEVLGTWIAFPLELLSLAAMLWLVHDPLPPLFLGAYAIFTALRMWHFCMTAVIVNPKPRCHIVLQEYYALFLPVAVLIAMRDWLVLIIHLALFATGAFRIAREAGSLLYRLASAGQADARASASTQKTVVNS